MIGNCGNLQKNEGEMRKIARNCRKMWKGVENCKNFWKLARNYGIAAKCGKLQKNCARTVEIGKKKTIAVNCENCRK